MGEKSPHKSFNIFEKIKNKFHSEKSHSDENVAFVDEKGRIFYIDIDGSYKDIKGRLVNENGQLIDADGNILEINLDEEENVNPDKEFLARFKNIFDWRGRKMEANELSETNLVFEHDTDSNTLESTKTFTIELPDHKEHTLKEDEIVVKEEIVLEHEKSPHKSFNILEKIKNTFHFEKSHSDENVAFVNEKGRIFYIDIDGSYKDINGKLVNENGELIDADGNILEIDLNEVENTKPDNEFLARFKNIFD